MSPPASRMESETGPGDPQGPCPDAPGTAAGCLSPALLTSPGPLQQRWHCPQGLVFGNTGNVEQAGIALRSLFCGSPPAEPTSEVSGWSLSIWRFLSISL